MSPIPVSIYIYKKEENEIVSIKQKKQKEKREETRVLEDINELNKEIEEINFDDFDYVSIFIKEKIDVNEIANIENVSNFENITVGKIKDKNIYIFSSKDKNLFEYTQKRFYELIEINLNIEKFEEVIKSYEEIFEKEDERRLKELMKKNRFYLSFLKEMDKKLAIIKEEFVNKENNINGLFHSHLRNVEEENIATLEAWIYISSNYFTQILQKSLNKKMLIVTIITAFISFLLLLPHLQSLKNLFSNILKLF